MAEVLGIHHMSAISGPSQENLDFFAGVLGFRLVKRTVNFDDPSAYHLYYGDGIGSPGTLVTFFPYPEGQPGRPGAGQATVTQLSIPPNATGFWVERFRRFDVDFDRPYSRDNRETTRFRGPDGLLLELVASPEHRTTTQWPGAPNAPEEAIGGILAFTLVERNLEPTQKVLEQVLGFQLKSEKHGRFRFGVCEGGLGKGVEVIVDPDGMPSRQGHGSVHHIAFRVASSGEQEEIRVKAVEHGLRVSDVKDRDYFKSIYFREPGGVLFEVATDGPGFTVDEPFESLGAKLRLPKQFEGARSRIERSLPPLELVRGG
jgi:glyoxalase family protein